MLEPFQLPFVQHGIVEVLILAVAGGLIGTWIVLRGLAFYAHAVGTAAFPGLVLADGLGFAAVLGAGATAALVAIAVGLLARREGARDRYDSLTALVLVAALAVGVILASDVFHSAGSVETLLFGSLLLVDGGDYAFAAVSAAIVVVGGLVLEQRWLATGFDPASARALGARSAAPDIALLALVALVAVAALSTLGALLATALLVVPAATTRLVCTRLRPWQLATVALVAVEGVAGLWLSVQVNAPPGPAIAVLAGGVFAAVAAGRVLAARRPAAAAVAVAALALLAGGCAAGGTRRRARPGQGRRDDDPDRRLRPRRGRRAGQGRAGAAAQHRSARLRAASRRTCARRPTPTSCSSTATSSTAGWATSSRRPAATRRSSTSARASR